MSAGDMSLAEARAYAHLLSVGLSAPEWATAFRAKTPKGTRPIVAICCADYTEKERLFDASEVYAYIENQAFLRFSEAVLTTMEQVEG